MAVPIVVSTSSTHLLEIKQAQSAIDTAISCLQQVDQEIDSVDVLARMSMFPNASIDLPEMHEICGLLVQMQSRLSSYARILLNGRQKIIDTDADFNHRITPVKIIKWLIDFAPSLMYSATIGSVPFMGIYWLHTVFSQDDINAFNNAWDEVPSEFKEAFKEIAGEGGKALISAVDITADVLSGEYDWDMLDTIFSNVEEIDSTKVSAVTKTMQTIVASDGPVNDLWNNMIKYQEDATDAFLKGDIIEGLVNSGKSLGCGLGAIGYGTVEVLTELASDKVDHFYDTLTFPVRFIRHFIPGKAGDSIYAFGDKLDEAADKITGFISGLL